MQEREFAYIHEHNFDDKMWSIAGKVDFLGLMEAGEFAVFFASFLCCQLHGRNAWDGRKVATFSKVWLKRSSRGQARHMLRRLLSHELMQSSSLHIPAGFPSDRKCSPARARFL